MEDSSLTFGAHLLLWVFPLALVVLVVGRDLLDRFKPESEQ
jgi:cytochrome c-type biogenesis protein CcmH/NrfF